ncbi:hypothetical protein TrRE_jg6927, partial [Triparma retinervis]
KNSATIGLSTSKLTATVTKDMPRCLQKLVQSIKSAESLPVTLSDGRIVRKPFMYMGSRYLATLDREEKEFKTLKERFREEREKRKMEKRAAGVNPGKKTQQQKTQPQKTQQQKTNPPRTPPKRPINTAARN